MFDKSAIAASLRTEAAKKEFHLLYGGSDRAAAEEADRYEALLETYVSRFGCQGETPVFFSSPGRTEIVGNHTDHNNGRVLAAAVTLDTLAAAAPTQDGIITLYSAGYDAPFVVDTADLEKKEEEKNTTFALIRGVCRKLRDMGYEVGGFNAAVTSRVLSGSGLSSSAAFEVLLVCILDGLYNGSILDGVTRAKISQWVENNYFGKPSGLMDQSACSIGGLVGIDFKHADPKISAYSFDFEARGFSLVVLATRSSHDDLTDEYASIPREMKAVAEVLGAVEGRESRRKERSQQHLAGTAGLQANSGQPLHQEAGDAGVARVDAAASVPVRHAPQLRPGVEPEAQERAEGGRLVPAEQAVHNEQTS